MRPEPKLKHPRSAQPGLPTLRKNPSLLAILACGRLRFSLDRSNTGLLRRLLPLLALGPCALALTLELVAARAEFRDGLLSEELLQRPLFDVLGLVVFELRDELYSACENAAFVLFAARHDLCDFVDTFVNGFTAAALNCSDGSAFVRCLLDV
jgi:hypothetical protein